MGKTRGPKVSKSFVKLHAGWNGDRRWPGGISAAPSEADLFLECPLPDGGRMDWKATDGELRGESRSGCLASPSSFFLFSAQ